MLVQGFHAYQKDGRGVIACSTGEIRTEAPFLDWILERAEEKNVCYDLDAFASALFRLIDISQDEATQLRDTERLKIPPYEITYFPGKFLSVETGKGWDHPYKGFYDMAQYFRGGIAPADLVEEPAQTLKKARIASAAASQVLASYQRLGLEPKLASPVSALRSTILKKMDLPTSRTIPDEVNQVVNDLALKCCGGSWREVFSMGYFKRVYDYDLSAAYAGVMSDLYDFRRGDWIESLEIPIDAGYGFARVKVNIKALFHPIQYRAENGETYTPIGSWETYLTLAEIQFIKHYHLGDLEILAGVWWIPVGKRGPNGEIFTREQNQPVKGLLRNLWEKRENGDKLDGEIVKRCMAGLWGLTLETYENKKGRLEYGELFNPVWGAMVEAYIRLAVARMAMKQGITPLVIAVDGLVTDTPIMGVTEAREMGSWRLSHRGAAIIAGSNAVAIETKENPGALSLRYEWLRQAIDADPGAPEYSMYSYGITTLADALNTDFSQLGNMKETKYTIRVRGDGKRYYHRIPKTGGDLLVKDYRSKPLTVGDIKAKGDHPNE